MSTAAFQRPQRAPNKHDLRQEFLSLYPNRHQSILKPKGCKGWVTMSRHAPLSDETIWAGISLHDETTWGCRWGEQTRFAVLDVDETSEYHNELGLARLRHVLSSVGLSRLQLHQSSESGGWHIYLFFAEWVNAQVLHACLKDWLKQEGFEIRPGQLEIFPSNNGLRLPLQRGFAWLDDQGVIKLRREDISTDEAVARFCHALDADAHDWPFVEECIKSRLEDIAGAAATAAGRQTDDKQEADEDGFSAFFSFAGMISEVYEAGREYWAKGLIGPSQRHHAILAVGHYLWYGDEAAGVRSLPGIGRAQQRAEAIEAWLREKHNGHSDAVLRGDWDEICADIRRACNWEASSGKETPRTPYLIQSDRAIDRAIGLTKAWGVTCQPKHFEKGNIGREEAAREKIRAALVQLLESNRRVTVVGLSRLSGCKKETVRRHLDIWGVFRLPKGPGDLSLGVGAPCPVPLAVPGPVAAASEREKENFLAVLGESDSGDLEPGDQGNNAEVLGVVRDDLNLDPGFEIGTQGTCMLRACSPVLNGRWRRRGKATGRRHGGSLASPPHTQPSTGSKHRLWGPAVALRHKRLPPQLRLACAGSPPFIPRADFSKGSGLVLLQEGGSSQAGRQRSVTVLSLAQGLFVIRPAVRILVKTALAALQPERKRSSGRFRIAASLGSRLLLPDEQKLQRVVFHSVLGRQSDLRFFKSAPKQRSALNKTRHLFTSGTERIFVQRPYRRSIPQTYKLPAEVRSAHSGVNGSQTEASETFRYEAPGPDSGCRQRPIRVFGISRCQKLLAGGRCIRVNSPQSKSFGISIYTDVRGPPKCIRA